MRPDSRAADTVTVTHTTAYAAESLLSLLLGALPQLRTRYTAAAAVAPGRPAERRRRATGQKRRASSSPDVRPKFFALVGHCAWLVCADAQGRAVDCAVGPPAAAADLSVLSRAGPAVRSRYPPRSAHPRRARTRTPPHRHGVASWSQIAASGAAPQVAWTRVRWGGPGPVRGPPARAQEARYSAETRGHGNRGC
jgi:hypothetical protein